MDKNYTSLESNFKTLIIGILFCMMVLGYCGIKIQHRQELQTIDNSFNALLQDTLQIVKNNKDTFWIQPISTIPPKDLIKLDLFDKLDSNQKVLAKELADKKDLLAALNVHVIATREENQKLKDSLNFWTQRDTFMAKDGTILTFQDTVGGFKYHETITLGDTIDRTAKYTLSFTPDIQITKINKYSVSGEWRMSGLEEFDNINLVNGYSFYKTTGTQPKLKPGLAKTLKITGIVGGSLLLSYGSFKLGQVSVIQK